MPSRILGLPSPAQGLVERDHADQFVQLGLRQLDLGVKEPGIGVQDLEVAGEPASVAEPPGASTEKFSRFYVVSYNFASRISGFSCRQNAGLSAAQITGPVT
jgi:hypothetical protein